MAAAEGPTHHALADTWVFWEQRAKNVDKEPWQERHLQLCEVDTVEAFWTAFTLLPTPLQYFGYDKTQAAVIHREDEKNPGQLRCSEVKQALLFRKGCEPFTEFKNAAGEQVNKSRVDVRMALRRKDDVKDAMEVWKEMLLMIVGGSISDEPSIVNGANISDKSKANAQSWRIEVWLNVPDSSPAVGAMKKHIERTFKKRRLNLSVSSKNL